MRTRKKIYVFLSLTALAVAIFVIGIRFTSKTPRVSEKSNVFTVALIDIETKRRIPNAKVIIEPLPPEPEKCWTFGGFVGLSSGAIICPNAQKAFVRFTDSNGLIVLYNTDFNNPIWEVKIIAGDDYSNDSDRYMPEDIVVQLDLLTKKVLSATEKSVEVDFGNYLGLKNFNDRVYFPLELIKKSAFDRYINTHGARTVTEFFGVKEFIPYEQEKKFDIKFDDIAVPPQTLLTISSDKSSSDTCSSMENATFDGKTIYTIASQGTKCYTVQRLQPGDYTWNIEYATMKDVYDIHVDNEIVTIKRTVGAFTNLPRDRVKRKNIKKYLIDIKQLEADAPAGVYVSSINSEDKSCPLWVGAYFFPNKTLATTIEENVCDQKKSSGFYEFRSSKSLYLELVRPGESFIWGIEHESYKVTVSPELDEVHKNYMINIHPLNSEDSSVLLKSSVPWVTVQ